MVWSNNCFGELIQIDQGNSNYKITAASDKDYQLLAHGQWFSPGTTASSTTKTGRHDIAEILLKLALNTINQSINPIINTSNEYLFIHLIQPIKLSAFNIFLETYLSK